MSFILYLNLVGGRDQKLVSNSVEEETEISSHTLALYALFSVKIYHDHHREKLGPHQGQLRPTWRALAHQQYSVTKIT